MRLSLLSPYKRDITSKEWNINSRHRENLSMELTMRTQGSSGKGDALDAPGKATTRIQSLETVWVVLSPRSESELSRLDSSLKFAAENTECAKPSLTHGTITRAIS